MKSGLEASATMSNVLESAQARKEADFNRIQANKQNAELERQRKREASETAAALKRETNERLEREFKFKYAELGQARALAGDDRKARMVLDAREKAMKAVYGDVNMTTASPEDREIAIDNMAAVLLKKPGANPVVQKTITQADIQATAKSSGKSVNEVIAAAKGKGYAIQ
jgi:hypothetical protein